VAFVLPLFDLFSTAGYKQDILRRDAERQGHDGQVPVRAAERVDPEVPGGVGDL
jgi:hypothetical protein